MFEPEEMQSWRRKLGLIAIQSHTNAIGNGQETEPLDTQAIDTITNILHCLRQHEGQLERSPLDAKQILRIAFDHFASEEEEA